MRMSLDVGSKAYGVGYTMSDYIMNIRLDERLIKPTNGEPRHKRDLFIMFESQRRTELSAGRLYIPIEVAHTMISALHELLINNEKEKYFNIREIDPLLIKCERISEKMYHDTTLSERDRRKRVSQW